MNLTQSKLNGGRRPLDPGPGRPLDPKVAGLRGLYSRGDVIASIRIECRDLLADTFDKVERMDRLYREVNTTHTEAAGLAAYEQQQRRAAERAKGGQPLDPEDTWSAADFVEEQAAQKEAKRSAAQAIGKEIATARTAIVNAFVKAATMQIQCVEEAETGLYEAYGMPYVVNDLVLSLRDACDFARSSYNAFVEILEAAATK